MPPQVDSTGVRSPRKGDLGPGQLPVWVSRLARVLEVVILVIVCRWVVSHLGGLGFEARRTRDAGMHITGTDTSRIFNWHPILNTLGFAVFMSEALLAYQAPAATLDRGGQKFVHVVMHSLALACFIFALIAAVLSHTLKEPVPIPNFYSAHSWLGLAVYIAVLLQALAGMGAFLFPKLPPKKRAELAPIHTFLGRCIYVLGLANMAVGIQEKASLTQLGKKLSNLSLRQPIMTLPAALLPLLAALGVLVLVHHSVLHRPEAPASKHDQDVNLLDRNDSMVQPDSPNAA
ncbi:hypothetical protein WJX73_007091 [Symbiochloris irregularis]|uniref:Cytochrome b561 domain-containing protein n=1 Tax=Symbiochloris irregularis TaxID=706552 RepID=A0AAW1NPY1_9CHLO